MKALKCLSLLALFLFHDTSANGKHCELEVDIECHFFAPEGPSCDELGTIGCGTIDTYYTFIYSNKHKTNDIQFKAKINPHSSKNEYYTFARANGKDANIQKGKILKGWTERRYTVKRNLKVCDGQNRFVAELQMNGFIAGKKKKKSFSCSARKFYSHYFNVRRGM